MACGWTLQAESPSKAEVPSAAAVVPMEKAKARTGEHQLQPRAPVVGQPFDDREIELYLDVEARKLAAAKLVHPLRFESRVCSVRLPMPPAEKLSGPEIAARAEAATLVVGQFSSGGKKQKPTFDIAGGGFAVSGSGVCVTSLHVLKEKSALGFCVMTRDGRIFPIREVLACEPVNDLAIFQLDMAEGATISALPIARDPAPVNSPIFVMSHPDDHFYLLTAGVVARHTIWRTEAGDEAFTTITADFAKGSSGCPVVDERGVVVGIVNNTESIYYDDDDKRKKQTDLQMVVKNATPSWAIMNMIEKVAVTDPAKP